MKKTLTTEQLKGRAKHYRANAKTYRDRGDLTEAVRMDCDAAAFEELAANRDAVPVGYIDPGSLKIYRGRMAGGTWSPEKRTLSGLNLTLPVYLSAPPAPDGYCVMPKALTAENGAKYALSGEFKVSRTVTCNECGGDGCNDCGDAGEFEEEITVPWDTIKEIYRAAVGVCGQTYGAPEVGN